MAFVVILHLPADRKSLLPEILSRWTTMRVIEATKTRHRSELRLCAAAAWAVDPGGRAFAGENARARRSARLSPIDAFFDALGTALREQAVGSCCRAPAATARSVSRPSRNAAA